ncbi:MAG: VWA domain-containing protein [Planctomycetes bacterium]|nr:VWA domain-containing protein [Planctomycetota bacterium]
MPKFSALISNRRNISAVVISTVVHAVLLIGMRLYYISVVEQVEDLAVDSIVDKKPQPKRPPQELLNEEKPATTLTTAVSGAASTTLPTPARLQVKAQQKVNIDNKLDRIVVDAPQPRLPSLGVDELTGDYGKDGVLGEPTKMVDGYGTALSLMTKELRRLMRTDKLLVVWLFDESESMKDDQQKIAAQFGRVYQELKIVQEQDPDIVRKRKALRRKRSKAAAQKNEILLTAIYGYGSSWKKLLDPTADLEKIVATIKSGIKIDDSGEEKTCEAIARTILKYKVQAARAKRRLVIIVVSDESGDDGRAVETTLRLAKGAKTPLYFLGREAIFGYPYARHRWKDEKYGLWHWLRINRGPETAFPECLQWDGLHARWDAFSSGFGPYEQVRLARETNGIFFVLPGEEENLSGAGAREKRQFAEHDMRQYHPLWQSRSDYGKLILKSKFRKQIWEIIVVLNPVKHALKLLPSHDPNLNIRQNHYPLLLDEFKVQAQKEVVKAFVAWRKLNIAIKGLESIKPLRAREKSERWRANYDLIRAQCLAYHVRLFQYMLAMDAHVQASPPHLPANKGANPSNEWNVWRTTTMIVCDDAQFERVKRAFKLKSSKSEFLALLDEEKNRATELYKDVERNHKGTPWARRAKYERIRGFGMKFTDRYWNPNYFRRDIKVPKF